MIGMAERSEWEGGRSPLPNFLLLDLSTTCTPEWIGPFQVPKKTSWISKMQTIQPKILDFLGAKLEKFRRFGYTLRGCPVFGNFEKCWSIPSWKLLKIQTGPFGWMESVPCNSIPCNSKRWHKTSTLCIRAKETKSYKAKMTLFRFLHQGWPSPKMIQWLCCLKANKH